MDSNRKVIEEVHEMRENMLSEMNKHADDNRRIHDEEKAKRRIIKEKKKMEDKVEMVKRKELISEIR